MFARGEGGNQLHLPLGSYGYNGGGAGTASATVEKYGLGGSWQSLPTGDGSARGPITLSRRPAEIVNPSRMIALGDTPLHVNQGSGSEELHQHTYGLPFLHEGHHLTAVQQEAGFPYPFPIPEVQTARDREAMRRRHRGWWNLVFCDGHVEQLKARQFFRRDDPLQNALWNHDHRSH